MAKPTKHIFQSVGGMFSLFGTFTALMAWYKQLPPELISDSQAFLILAVNSIITLWGRWRAQMPLRLLPKA